MQDFDVFLSATSIIFSGGISYGKVGFYAPSWISILLFPFTLIPDPLNKWIWQIAIIAAMSAACIFSVPKSRIFPLLVIFSPASMLTLVTGQLSAFVALASTGLLVEAAARKRTGILLVCCFVALSKPHLAALPIGITLVDLIRKKERRKAIYIITFFIGLGLLSEFFLPGSTRQWLMAMFSGNYKTGDVTSLQYVLLSNGIMIPIGTGYYQGCIFFFIPVFLGYLYIYFKESLSPRVIALTLSILFLGLPYYRLYDFLMLIYPAGLLYQSIFGGSKLQKNCTCTV